MAETWGMSGLDTIKSLLMPSPNEIIVLVVENRLSFGSFLSQLVSSNELAFAGSFHFEADRLGFLVQRGLLRLGASCFVGSDPQAIYIDRDQFGRPLFKIDGMGVASSWDINVSRTHEYSGIALSRDQCCGVDLEWIDSAVDITQVTSMYPLICDLLGEKGDNQEKFYQIWTQLESILKADGRGLSGGLEIVEFQRNLGITENLWRIDEKTWVTESISVPTGVVGNVAFERVGTRVTQITQDEIQALLPTRILCALEE